MTCPDPGLIAAHAEGRLKGAEAKHLDEHIAGCADCSQVFGDTVEFGLADGEAVGVQTPVVRVAARPAFALRPALKVAAGLSIAAALVIAFGSLQLRRAPVSALAQLAEAIGTKRFIEPRLTGGFDYGRLVILRSGETTQKLDAQPAAVIAAVAKIRAQAEGDTSPKTLGALGITYLVSGDVAAAVKALESATAQEPDNPRLLSDLAAAYLARAEQLDEPADIPKALEATEKAIILNDPPNEAWFNRALALEKLHLVDAARKAWDDYLERDAASGWADEARQHKEALPMERRSSTEQDGARVRAALEEGQVAVDRLAAAAPSLLRDYFDDVVLPAWAEAHLVGHPDAEHHREAARVVGEALLRATNDGMPLDAARALDVSAGSTTALDPLRSQATGYQSMREGKRLDDRSQAACRPYRSAVRDLEAGGSPYALAARLEMVARCLLVPDQKAALAELDRLESSAKGHGYGRMLGRALWLEGTVHVYRGELADSLGCYRDAWASFRQIRDVDGEAAMCASVAEALLLQGEVRESWKARDRCLAMQASARSVVRRHNALAEAVWACVDERMPRTALHFEAALVDAALASSREILITEAFSRRAATLHALGADGAALSDLDQARDWVGRIADPTHIARQTAEVDALEGEVLTTARPEKAADSLGRALAYFQSRAPVRVPALHLLRSRAQIAQGHDDAAEQELEAGIQALERGRASLRDASAQRSFFDQALPFFDDMIRLQVTRRYDEERALSFVERAHARQLLDSLGGGVIQPLATDALRRNLPIGLALLYYVPLDDRLYMWSLSREGCHFIERPVSASELSRLVAANRAAIEGRASPGVVRRTAARLHDELVHPFIPFIGSERALVFIPDGVLQSVAFAALWNPETARYLVEDHMVVVAPSGTVFVRASGRASRPTGMPSAVVVGNPSVDRHLAPGLVDLPGAEAEAVEITRLYPGAELLTGTHATRAAFLESARNHTVVHYAGHAVSSDAAPSSARLVFAEDAQGSGSLFLQKLDREQLSRVRVVVLAACRTAAGPASSVEGALSLGRPFLAAGVPSVVASLWDIDDGLSRRFFVAFHRLLITEGDSVSALRKAQIAYIRSGDALLAHPASWAPFISIGGIDLHSLSKGESS